MENKNEEKMILKFLLVFFIIKNFLDRCILLQNIEYEII